MIHMLSAKYFLDETIGYNISQLNQATPGYIRFLFEEMDEIKTNLPKSYDPTSCIIAVTRPLIEMTMCNAGLIDHNNVSKSAGKTPISLVSLMQIHLLSTLHEFGSYRHVEQVLNRHKLWLHALKLSKSPHHSTMGKFRKALGEKFFKNFFDELLKIMIDSGIVNPENTALNIDSAPFKACMNFARANADIKLDYNKLESLFDSIKWNDIVKNLKLLKSKHKKLYTSEMLLKFLIFEQIGGFLSRSQAIKHVKSHKKAHIIIGFPENQIPTQASISNFAKIVGKSADLINLVRDPLFQFFDINKEHIDPDIFPIFFLEDVE